jgi:hypothetical protein
LERLKQEKSIYVPDTEHGLGNKNNILDKQETFDKFLFP